MRLSSKESDPGYATWCSLLGGRIDVHLDGIEQKDCLMADEEAGEIIRLQRGDDGELLVIDDCLVEEMVRGSVMITVADATV